MKKLSVVVTTLFVLGIFSSSILNADAAGRVRGYYRSNGTYVQPYYRSAPNGNPYDNWSFPGNTNPYTGKVGPGNPDTYLKNYYNRRSTDGTYYPSINSAPLYPLLPLAVPSSTPLPLPSLTPHTPPISYTPERHISNKKRELFERASSCSDTKIPAVWYSLCDDYKNSYNSTQTGSSEADQRLLNEYSTRPIATLTPLTQSVESQSSPTPQQPRGYPKGTLLRKANDPTIWYVSSSFGLRKRIPSASVFESCGFRWDKVLIVDAVALEWYSLPPSYGDQSLGYGSCN